MSMSSPMFPFGHVPPVVTPPPSEPMGLLDLEEPPSAYGIDEAGVYPRDPHSLLLYWEATWGGDLRMRLHPSRDGETLADVEIPLESQSGRRYVATPYPGDATHVSATLGRFEDGRFHPVALAPRVRLPSDRPGHDGVAEWIEVEPLPRGSVERERPTIVRRGPGRLPGEAGVPRWDTMPAATAPSSPAPTSPTRSGEGR